MAVTESDETDLAIVNATREVIAAHQLCDEAGEALAFKRRILSDVFPSELVKHNVVVEGQLYEVHRFDAVTPPSIRHLGPAIQDATAISAPAAVQAQTANEETKSA